MLSLLLSLAIHQAAPQAAPVLPPGLNSAFSGNVQRIEERLQTGDFEGAKEALNAMPRMHIRYSWDDSEVPAIRRGEFKEARDAAFKKWTTRVAGLTFEAGSAADIAYSFKPTLPQAKGSPVPAGAVHMLGTTDGVLHLDSIIALNRLAAMQEISSIDVTNEVAYSVSAYLGLERFPGMSSAVTRSDQPMGMVVGIGSYEASMTKAVFAAVDKLRKAVGDHVQMTPAKPALVIEPAGIAGIKKGQAEPLEFTVKVTNTGNSDLQLMLQPDCNCLRADYPLNLKPNESGEIHGRVDTIHYAGELHHELMIYSNDPNRPLTPLPVHVNVEPLYQMVTPGPYVFQMGKNGAEIESYLIVSDPAKFQAKSARLEGVEGTVVFHPWTGVMDVPEMGGTRTHSGYKFHVHLKPTSVPGRASTNLVVSTSNEQFPEVLTTIWTQKGIITLPMSLYLGETEPKPKHFQFIVSRPEKDFEIKKVVADSPCLQASAKAIHGHWEYLVSVDFNGKADFGMFSSIVKVYTDQPEQPLLQIPVTGIIK